MFIRARDGTQLYVRHVKPADSELIAEGWLHLSRETQQKRFLAPKPRLTAGDLRYLTEIDGHDHVALIALRLHEPKQLVAVARYVRLKDDPEIAEVAVTVADGMQGQRIGSMLGVLLADEARGRGIKRFSASILTDNRPALRLMSTLSQRLEGHSDHGVRELVADLAAERDDLRATGRQARPPYVHRTAVGAGGERSGCLIGFATQCSIHPPRFLVCISKENRTYDVVGSAAAVVVHFLGAEQRELATLLAGRPATRWTSPSSARGLPAPRGFPSCAMSRAGSQAACSIVSTWGTTSGRGSSRSKSRTTAASSTSSSRTSVSGTWYPA